MQGSKDRNMENEILQKNEPLLCTLHSNDANHQATNLINWQQEFDQLSQGRFAGEIKELHFPHIHVFREDTSHSLRQQCRVESGGLWLGLSTNEKNCYINHEQTNSNHFLCRPGSQDFELVTPDQFSIYGLVLHPSFFTELVGTENEMIMDNEFNNLWLEKSTAKIFKQYLYLLLQSKGHQWSNHTHELILQDAVIELLSNTQNIPVPHVTSLQRHRIMARVQEYLTEERMKSPVTINEICAAVHVSRRTLQYTFTQCFGIAPKQYIQAIRLNQVRRELSCKENLQTISDIATNYGFFHLSQFSQSYKHLFGESPQQTRQRF
jgi:AraC family ethanolamine operon transcriptional activator